MQYSVSEQTFWSHNLSKEALWQTESNANAKKERDGDKKSTIVLSPNTWNWQPDKVINDEKQNFWKSVMAAGNVYLNNQFLH